MKTQTHTNTQGNQKKYILGNLFRNLYAKFVILEIKFHFTCGKLNFHENTVNCQNIIAKIVALTKLSF